MSIRAEGKDVRLDLVTELFGTQPGLPTLGGLVDFNATASAGDLLERSPRAVSGWDRIGIQPTAVGEAVEVDAGISRRIAVGRAQGACRQRGSRHRRVTRG